VWGHVAKGFEKQCSVSHFLTHQLSWDVPQKFQAELQKLCAGCAGNRKRFAQIYRCRCLNGKACLTEWEERTYEKQRERQLTLFLLPLTFCGFEKLRDYLRKPLSACTKFSKKRWRKWKHFAPQFFKPVVMCWLFRHLVKRIVVWIKIVITIEAKIIVESLMLVLFVNGTSLYLSNNVGNKKTNETTIT
jgi:hypothetical protein